MFEPRKGDQGKFVCQIMKERGISSAEMAEMLHVTESAISKWRRGKSDPSREIIPAIAKILGITETEIYRAKLLAADETLEERIAVDVDRLRKATGSSISCGFGLPIVFSSFFSMMSFLMLFDFSLIPFFQMLVWVLFLAAFMGTGCYVTFNALKPSKTGGQ